MLDLTENVRKAIDENKFAVGVFVDLQKAFDTVDHEILLKKLNHYGIRGIANKWFNSYLSDRYQFVTTNGKESDVKPIKHGVPQGSVLGPLLFLLYINDLHNSIKYSTTRHFADDTNLLIVNSSLKQLKKHLNFDLKHLSSWLKANKISLNASKTEILIFRHARKPINYDLKVKLDGKKLHSSKFVKYLGLLIDPHLNWSYHTKSLASKLNRASGMLSKIRHYVDKKSLVNVYYAIFSSILSYGSQIWGQHHNQYVNHIIKIQNKAMRIINFRNNRTSSSELYKNSNILKFKDQITIANYLLVHDSLNRRTPLPLQGRLHLIRDSHNYHVRNSAKHCVKIPPARTTEFGIHSILGQAARNWNYFQILYHDDCMHIQTRNKCKNKLRQHFLNSY